MHENSGKLVKPEIKQKLIYPLKKVYLIIELFALFWLLPTLYVMDLVRANVIFILLIIMLFCLFSMLGDKTFDKTQLWNLNIFRSQQKRIFQIFVINALIITTLMLIFKKSMLFGFPKTAPFVYMIVIVLYPLLSVYPQELVYRTFFFHRYKLLFPKRLTMIAASAVAFGYMHIVFENTIAVMMTLAGGFLFANTYDETRSTLAVWFEHSLYGCFLFTIGLGRYFYHGAVN